MCYYCCYLTRCQCSTSLSTKNYDKDRCLLHFYSHKLTQKQQQQNRRHLQPYRLTMSLCLVSLTLFFMLLNVTLVLSHSQSQSSQTNQQRDHLSKTIHYEHSQGNLKAKNEILIYFLLKA